MGQKINPSAFRLTVANTWTTIENPALGKRPAYAIDFINPFIHNTFLAFNILTSLPIIKQTPGGGISIMVKVYPIGKDQKRVAYVKEYIKALLQKKFNTRIQITIVVAPTMQSNAKILGDWIAINIAAKPLKLKSIIKKIF